MFIFSSTDEVTRFVKRYILVEQLEVKIVFPQNTHQGKKTAESEETKSQHFWLLTW